MADPKYEKYSFLWSELRLIIASIALFLGGIPPVWKLGWPASMFGLVSSLLKLSWIISGVASAYLLYLYNSRNQTVFGGKKQNDIIAFSILVISGLNIGIVGLFGTNIGMSITSNKLIFIAVGILYIVTAVYLYNRWQQNSRKLF